MKRVGQQNADEVMRFGKAGEIVTEILFVARQIDEGF
ncbi:unnamed protein product [Schistosoma mattheei]|uniref:Uncharacterized protein n=1 Tax=Schistosoma mattheei TaxID=31246 RepID=A0A183Q3A1_9TREM|nr:unnamed protein product [Schistosoma mattheei]